MSSMQKVLREYQALVQTMASEAKDFNLVRDGDIEAGSGLWDPETRAAIDAYTLKTLFFTEDWVYIVVDLIAMKISNQYLRVMHEITVDGKTKTEPAEDHPVQKTIDNPNKHQDYHAWMYSTVVDTTLIGNSVVWTGLNKELLITVPVEQITATFDGNGAIDKYLVTQMTAIEEMQRQRLASLPVDQVCHVRRPNPSSALWGLSPFIPGKKSMLFNRYSSEYLNNFYLKGATPGLTLEMEDGANEQNALRLLRSFEMAYTGRRNQRRTLVLPKGVKAKDIAHSLADQQLSEYINKNRETILALLKVPPHEVGIQKSGSLGSEEYKTALKNFWSSTLKPMMRLIAGALTKHFKDKLGEGYYLDFVVDDIDILQENQTERALLAEHLLKTHTLNEVRANLYGLGPVAGGEMIMGQAPIDLLSPVVDVAPNQAKPADDATAEQAAENQLTSPTQSLNGAQVQALVGIVQSVERGELPRAAAVNIIRVSFALSQNDAEAVMGEAGLSEPEKASHRAAIAALQVTDAPSAANVPGVTASEAKDGLPPKDGLVAVRLAANDWFQKREKITQAAVDEASEKIKPVVLELLADLATLMIKGVKAALAEKAAERQIPKAELRRRLNQLTKKSNFKDRWVSETVRAFESTVESGYDAALSVPFKLPNTEQLAAIRVRNADARRAILEDRGLFSFAKISEATTDRVMDIVDRGIKEQMTVDQIVRAIASHPQFSRVEDVNRRAETIARTETLVATSIGQAAMMEDAAEVIPNLKKMWVTARDNRVRGKEGGLYEDSSADHDGMDGDVVDHDKPFVDPRNGDRLMYPRDLKGRPDSVINCRCSMIVLPEDQMQEFS